MHEFQALSCHISTKQSTLLYCIARKLYDVFCLSITIRQRLLDGTAKIGASCETKHFSFPFFLSVPEDWIQMNTEYETLWT